MSDVAQITTLLNDQSNSMLANRQQTKGSSAIPTDVSSSASQICIAFPDFQEPVTPELFPDSLLQMFVTIVAT